jgi:predicted RNA binding protein YcfA (HicA-like mRNA interferase family)
MMKTGDLVLRCFAEKRGSQWQAFCLDLCLAAQADSFEESRAKLESMICSYVEDATVGEDREFGADLLRRSAPVWDWVRYYAYAVYTCLMRHGVMRLFKEVLPLQPAPKCHA